MERPVTTTPILLDVQALQRPETAGRGIGRYLVGLARAMLDAGLPVVGLGLNPSLPRPDDPPPDLVGSSLWCWTTRSEVRRRVGSRGLIHLVGSPLGPADVATDGVFPPWLSGPGVRRATVVHDLIPYLFPEHYIVDDASRAFHDERRAAILSSDLLLANSETTRADVIREWNVAPDAVVDIGAPWPREFTADGPVAGPAVSRSRYVLAPIGYDWRKEPSRLIEGWSRLPRSLRRDRQLVLVGEAPEHQQDEWVRRGRRAGLKRGDVVTTGRVTDQELGALYRGAELVVHGSRYEGFGLPVVEASQCGAPSITSDRGSLPEILDEAESVFDPDDPASVAAAMRRALEDDEVRERLLSAAARASSPGGDRDIGGRTAAALATLDPVEPFSPRPSLLVVGGSPASAEQVGTASVDVTRRVAGDRGSSGPAAAHDGLVYVLDDGEDDTEVMREALRHPGVVLCRRPSLAPLWVALAVDETDDDEGAVAWLHRVLERSYQGAHPPSFPADDVLDPAVWQRFGLLGFGALLERSLAVLVSPASFEPVRADVGPDAAGSLVVAEPQRAAALARELALGAAADAPISRAPGGE